jgi:hypothetical protein
MNTLSQHANEVFNYDAIDAVNTPLLILDALDLAVVGGGTDMVAV